MAYVTRATGGPCQLLTAAAKFLAAILGGRFYFPGQWGMGLWGEGVNQHGQTNTAEKRPFGPRGLWAWLVFMGSCSHLGISSSGRKTGMGGTPGGVVGGGKVKTITRNLNGLYGARGLLAALLATATDDLLSGDDRVVTSAKNYFASPWYRYHLSLLDLPDSILPTALTKQDDAK